MKNKSNEVIFASVEEAQTSTDPVKLERAMRSMMLQFWGEYSRGYAFHRGQYYLARCAAHYYNRLAAIQESVHV